MGDSSSGGWDWKQRLSLCSVGMCVCPACCIWSKWTSTLTLLKDTGPASEPCLLQLCSSLTGGGSHLGRSLGPTMEDQTHNRIWSLIKKDAVFCRDLMRKGERGAVSKVVFFFCALQRSCEIQSAWDSEGITGVSDWQSPTPTLPGKKELRFCEGMRTVFYTIV